MAARLEFKDGPRMMPSRLADLLDEVDTKEFTFIEAMEMAHLLHRRQMKERGDQVIERVPGGDNGNPGPGQPA